MLTRRKGQNSFSSISKVKQSSFSFRKINLLRIKYKNKVYSNSLDIRAAILSVLPQGIKFGEQGAYANETEIILQHIVNLTQKFILEQ